MIMNDMCCEVGLEKHLVYSLHGSEHGTKGLLQCMVTCMIPYKVMRSNEFI